MTHFLTIALLLTITQGASVYRAGDGLPEEILELLNSNMKEELPEYTIRMTDNTIFKYLEQHSRVFLLAVDSNTKSGEQALGYFKDIVSSLSMNNDFDTKETIFAIVE